MSLFEKLNNKRSSLHEVKDDEIKKPTKKANKEVFDVTGKSAARDAKKYSSGEYPKIGGGERMSPKSKGPGASTGGTNTPPATVGGKSKGTTPVKVNITKPIKQSEVSKKAKEFTQNLKKIKGTKTGKPISTGDIGFTAPDRKTKVAKRTTRAVKQGTPDPLFSKTKFSQKGFEKSLKKITKGPGTGIVDPFGKGDTPGQTKIKAMDKKAFKITQKKDVQLPKSFTDFSKKLKTLKTDVAKTSSATPRTVTKKYKPSTPKTPSQIEVGGGGGAGSKPPGGTRTVKQSEVSKKAKEFTKKINQKKTTNTAQKMRTVKGDPLQGNVDYDKPVKSTPKSTPKIRDSRATKAGMPDPFKSKSTPKPKTNNVFKKVSKATSGKKITNSKGIGNKFRGKENLAAKDARIKLDQNAAYGGGGKPPKPPNKPLSSPAPEPNNNSNKIVKQSKYDKVKAGIDARNPTKPGQYTGKPVPLKQREYTSFKNKYLSAKGKKFVQKVPKIFKNKTFAKIGKTALKNPYVAAGAGAAAAVAGTALLGYGAYKGIKGLINKPKVPSLKTSDLKSGGTVTYGTGKNKGKAVRFDAMSLGFTKKDGVEKKKPTYKDFQSGKYTYK